MLGAVAVGVSLGLNDGARLGEIESETGVIDGSKVGVSVGLLLLGETVGPPVVGTTVVGFQLGVAVVGLTLG
jgi:hypothetical protein